MSRRAFIESHGATCRRWNWSWSFVNHQKHFVIFGPWHKYDDGWRALIFSEGWRTYTNGRKSAEYDKSREHIRLVQEEGYIIRTFPMLFSKELQDASGDGPAKIGGFRTELSGRLLVQDGGGWFAIALKVAS